MILQFQNKSDIDSEARVSLFKDNSVNAVNHILPAYAKFIIWAAGKGTEKKKGGLGEMLSSMDWLMAEHGEEFEEFRQRIAKKKCLMEQ